MSKKFMLVTIAVLISMVTVVPVLAASPADGIVVEGIRVPGVSLDDSRAQVEAAWGQPYLCKNMRHYYGRLGFKASAISMWTAEVV